MIKVATPANVETAKKKTNLLFSLSLVSLLLYSEAPEAKIQFSAREFLVVVVFESFGRTNNQPLERSYKNCSDTFLSERDDICNHFSFFFSERESRVASLKFS